MTKLPAPEVQYMVVHDRWGEAATLWPKTSDIEVAKELKRDWEKGALTVFSDTSKRASVRIVKITSTYEWFDE